jgi:hypothetical protein
MVFLTFREGAPVMVEKLSPARAATLAGECSVKVTKQSLRTLATLAEGARKRLHLTHGGDEAADRLLPHLD